MFNRRSFFAASAAGIAAGVLPGVEAMPETTRWITCRFINGMWVETGRSDVSDGIQFVRPGKFKTNQFVQISQR